MLLTAVYLRPALISALSSFLTLFTAILSVTLTYLWQSSQRSIDRPPFISDAHYDDFQSPIFAVTATITALSIALTVLLTWFVSLHRLNYHRNNPAASHSKYYCPFPLRIRGRAQQPLCAFAGLFGLSGALFLILAAATNTKASFHIVAFGLSLGANVLWAFIVSLTLESPGTDSAESKLHLFCLLSMQLCVLLFAACAVAFAVLHWVGLLFAAAVLEYIDIAATAVFLLLLSFRMTTSRVVSVSTDHAEEFPNAARCGERGESVDMQV